MHAPKIVKGSCTTQQIDGYYKSCLPPTSCDSFRAANASCVQCIESKDTDATWGPIVTSGFTMTFNPSGCMVALTGDSSETSCAQRFDDLSQCEAAACQAQCPLTDQASAILLEQCDSAASAGECAKFAAAECGPDAGAPYTQCVAASSNDPEAGFDAIAAAMCGP